MEDKEEENVKWRK